jgi:hypothetical protein
LDIGVEGNFLSSTMAKAISVEVDPVLELRYQLLML